MEESLVSGMAQLASYGALGIVAVYFMVKDWQISGKLNEALKDFTVAMNLLCAKVEDK